MNIAMATHKFGRGDGQGRINYEIVKAGLAAGHSFTMFASAVDGDLIDAGAKWIKITPPFRKPDLLNVVSFAAKVDLALASLPASPDIVVANGFTLRSRHDINLCHFVHGSWIRSPFHVSRQSNGPYSWYQWLYSKYNARAERQSYSAAQCVVALSQMIRRELLSIGVPDNQIRLIYNAVDLEEFRPGAESREELGLPENVPLALFVGDIRSTRKNLDTVLKAMVQVPDLHLAVVGRLKGSPFPAMAERLGVAGRVHFLDFRSDVGRIMRAVDLFVFPSRYDTFALVVLEALATGVPVITASTVGASELMTPECGRVMKDPNDVNQLVIAIREMLGDATFRANAPAAARRVAEQHGWARMAKQYLDLMEECHAQRPPV